VEASKTQLWSEENGVHYPLATRCAVCDRTSFPPAARCRHCTSTEVQQVRLSAAGVVEAATLMGDRQIIHVRTTDGILLLGQAVPAGRVRVGSRVRFSPVAEQMRFELDE